MSLMNCNLLPFPGNWIGVWNRSHNFTTLTSNVEKKKIMSMEISNSINTCSSGLFFVWKFYVLGENAFFTISDTNFHKNLKFYWKAALWVRKKHTKCQGNISTNNVHSCRRLKYLTTVNTFRWCVSFGVEYTNVLVFAWLSFLEASGMNTGSIISTNTFLLAINFVFKSSSWFHLSEYGPLR